MSKPSIKAYLFLRLLNQGKFGTLTLDLPDQKTHSYGEGDPHIHIVVKNWSALDRIVDRSDIGLALGIMDGQIIVDNIPALIEWVCVNDEALGKSLKGTWTGMFFSRLKYWVQRNDKARTQKIMQTHDEHGNEFYRLWLGAGMNYSSGIFLSDSDDLETSHLNKFRRIVSELKIKKSDHVLDIGCGWGGWFQFLAQEVGCKVTAVTNSKEQIRYCELLIKEQGLKGLVELQNADYRDIRGKFDKITCIEMLESVGEEYWPVFFKRMRDLLKPNGAALLQTSTIAEQFYDDYRSSPDFLQTYVFPGNILPSVQRIKSQAAAVGLKCSEPFLFSDSYVKTLQAWRRNFNHAIKDVREMGFDDRFIRMWDLYLAYCEGAVRANRATANQFLLS